MNPNGCKTIVCCNVPSILLNKTEAKRYFKTFGCVLKIIVKSKSKKLIVEYKSTDGAQEAFTRGGRYGGGEFRIDFQPKSNTNKQKLRVDLDQDWKMDENINIDLEPVSISHNANNSTSSNKQNNFRVEKVAAGIDVNSCPRSVYADTKKYSTDATVGTKIASLNAEKVLFHLLKKRAENFEDKYRILDARDKLIRLKYCKNVGKHLLGVTVGTCPDMCPEKERLMREVQHQVPIYEQTSDRLMNHAVAVKQYSRSSADQETPLPHELRGVDVLQMTMGYLMHRIMMLADAPDVNLGDWYHFLWDRMRGIRKDITQQELCCQGSVLLVEQCARFHVHCSGRLVAEDPSVFDQKINTENLTKCLQTLKYMYHDLSIKGEHCPNEAEFRAYVILLNLNDGNFMWEVQRLHSNIQQSSEVKFAMEVYSSLDNNNFVKFFKLVRGTTYLNGCILLRYFVQVRTKALRTIARCYTPRMPHAHFPIGQLTEMLAFESEASCIDFAEFCGLMISPDMMSVVLNKRDFTEPEVPYALDRAIGVIESKRYKSLGEVVCGNELPPPIYKTHTIQNSFTSDGYLINLNEFVANLACSKDSVTRQEVPNLFEAKANSPFENQNSEGGWRNVRISEPTTAPVEMCGIFTKQSDFAVDLATPWELEVERENEERIRREQITAEKEEQRNYEQKQMIDKLLQQQREHQRRLLEAARIEVEQRRLEMDRQQKQHLVEEHERRRKINAEEAKRNQKLLEDTHRQHLAQQAEAKRLQEISTVVQIVVDKMIIEVEENYRCTRLNELKNNALARLMLQKWRRKVYFNRRKRKTIDQGPLWINRLTTCEMARELYSPHQNLTLNFMKRYKRGTASGSSKDRTFASIDKLDSHKLRDLTANQLLASAMKIKRLQNEIFWKIGVYFDGSTVVRETLDTIIGWDGSGMMLHRVKLNQNTFTYCLHKSEICVHEGEAEDMNGLVIIVHRLSESLVDSLLRYLNTLGYLEYIPVYFVVEEVDERLHHEVRILMKNNLMSAMEYFVCAFTPENLAMAFERGLSYLAQHYTPPPPLLLNALGSFLAENLGREFFQNVRAFAKCNHSYRKCIAHPKVAIGLFNQGLQMLNNILFNEQREEYGTFPATFKAHLLNKVPDYLPCDYKYFPKFWKSEEYNSTLRMIIEKFSIPEYQQDWSLETTAETKHQVFDYCRLICNTLQETQHLFLKISAKLFRANQSESWLDVAEVIFEHNLAMIDLTLPVRYGLNTTFKQFFVVYEAGQLQDYMSDTWYYIHNPLIQEVWKQSNSEDYQENRNAPEYASCKMQTEEVALKIPVEVPSPYNLDVKEGQQSNAIKSIPIFNDFRFLMDDLEESIRIQRIINQNFQTNVKHYLENA